MEATTAQEVFVASKTIIVIISKIKKRFFHLPRNSGHPAFTYNLAAMLTINL